MSRSSFGTFLHNRGDGCTRSVGCDLDNGHHSSAVPERSNFATFGWTHS